jgi:hypothetical protein
MNEATTDNVAPASDAQAVTQASGAPAQAPTPVDPRTKIPEFFTIAHAIRCTSEYYGRDFKTLNFSPPSQILDGCVVEFIDPTMGVTVSTARLRTRNFISLNKDTGDMLMPCHLSDLAFTKPSVPISLTPPVPQPQASAAPAQAPATGGQ